MTQETFLHGTKTDSARSRGVPVHFEGAEIAFILSAYAGNHLATKYGRKLERQEETPIDELQIMLAYVPY